MHDDNFFTKFLLSIPLVIVLWLCVWLSVKFNKWLGLRGRFHKREKDISTNDSQERKRD
jgi:hypothetical protein